jgi:putative ABC transport system ATP-binding protein
LELLQESAVRPDRCVIIVTHDSRIYEFADRIVQMDDGRVVGQFDDPSQLSHA